jgi:hypothetical protein
MAAGDTQITIVGNLVDDPQLRGQGGSSRPPADDPWASDSGSAGGGGDSTYSDEPPF